MRGERRTSFPLVELNVNTWKKFKRLNKLVIVNYRLGWLSSSIKAKPK